MRPCLNLTTLLRADLEKAIAAAAAAGFESVELWVDTLERYLDTHTTDDLRGLLDKHGIQVASIGDVESVTFCNPEQFEELHRRCKNLASVAVAISCPTIVASASVRPRKADDSEIAEETASVIGKLLDIVEPAGVGLAFAFRGFNWCAVNSLDQVLEAAARHAGRRIGLVVDTFDLHATGVQPETLKSIDPSQVSVVRLSDCEDVPAAILSETARVLPGEGAARLDDMLNALAAAGYTGDVSLKIFNQRIWDLEAEEAAKIVMAITEQYLPGKLSDVNAQDT